MNGLYNPTHHPQARYVGYVAYEPCSSRLTFAVVLVAPLSVMDAKQKPKHMLNIFSAQFEVDITFKNWQTFNSTHITVPNAMVTNFHLLDQILTGSLISQMQSTAIGLLNYGCKND